MNQRQELQNEKVNQKLRLGWKLDRESNLTFAVDVVERACSLFEASIHQYRIRFRMSRDVLRIRKFDD